MLALRGYRNLRIAHDGRRIGYAVSPSFGSGRRSLFVVDNSPSAKPRRITAAPDKEADERALDFSPDGKTVALISIAEKQARLFVVDLTGSSPPRELGNFTGFLGPPHFSPDGSRIALLQTQKGTEQPAVPMSEPSPPSRIAIVDLATSTTSFASPPDLHVYEFDWSPNGREIAMTASPAEAHPNYYVAKLHVVGVDGSAPRVVFEPKLQIADPRFSPDGTQISFVGGLMSDEGNSGGDLFVVPAAGGVAKNITPKRKATIVAARWKPDGHFLLVDEIVEGQFALSLVPSDGSGPGETLFRADAALRGFTASDNGETVAFLHDTFDAATSIWAGPARAPSEVEPSHQAFAKPWGDVKTLHASSDAFSIQSFLIAPPKVEQGRKYPLLTLVHGGPAASWVPAANEYEALAAEGYFLLLPNPRGSFGFGSEFQTANVKDFGYGDLRDIRASVKAAIREAPIDPERIGIFGWSYGGFMAMWAVTQTSDFRAAVAGAGIANWQSYYGQNDIPGWLLPYFGVSVYEDPTIYSKSSPIAFIKQVKAPTLMIVGDQDTDCPPAQSREFWQGLKTLGVPTDLVTYPGESHGFGSVEHRRDRVERIAGWFNRYLGH